MIRNTAKLAVLGALALAGGAVGLNCSKESSPSNSGDLKIAFAIPNGTTISQVNYAMTLNGAAGPSGHFDTSDQNASPSFDIALQPSTNDTITLTATTSAGTPVNCTTGASPAFNIVSNTPTTVSLTLVCGTGSATTLPGTVDVRANVTTSDNCPNITQVVVAPFQTSVGGTISLSAVASDSDTADVLSYSWTATGGTLASPTGASDTYTCGTAGPQSVTVAVNDNHVGGGCTASIILPVNCVAVATGTGGSAAGAPGTGGSAAGAPGTGGSAAGAPGTGGSAAGAPGTGGAAGAPATGGTTGTGGQTMGAGPGNEDAPSCVACEKGGSSLLCTQATYYYSTDGSFGCDSFTGAADKANCLALVQCLRSTACQQVIAQAPSDFTEAAQGNGDPFPCLCNNTSGTQITAAACSALASWTGICAQQYVTAESTQAAPNVLADFYNYITPIGVASHLLACDIESSPSCKSASTCNIPQ